jgi:outer membrane protein OmpA-like peptidoglycan-associated protein/opacity protein-like surface antigen
MGRIVRVAVLSVIILSTGADLQSQSVAGRAGVGVVIGSTTMLNDFQGSQFWLGGGAHVRYNVLDHLSVIVQGAYYNPRYDITADNAIPELTDYFPSNTAKGGAFANGTKISADGINNTLITTLDALVQVNVFPHDRFNPFVQVGIGYSVFSVRPGTSDGSGMGRAGSDDYYLPGQSANEFSTTQLYEENALTMPLGAGVEYFVNRDLALTGSISYRLFFTDYLDDYSPGTMLGYDSKTSQYTGPVQPAPSGDVVSTGSNDAMLNIGVGVTWYFMGKADTDEDGLTDGEERDYGTNPELKDTDGDGLDDPTEVDRSGGTDPLVPDTDGDGLVDGREVRETKTKPGVADTDGDGLSDGDEIQRGTDPLKDDTDGDGLTDGIEVTKHRTDPKSTDTDQDGLADADEITRTNTDPLLADTDKDGLLDNDELTRTKTDPVRPDTDNDGVIDGVDQCPTFKGVPPTGCMARNTVADFPGVLFKVNTPDFEQEGSETGQHLARIRELLDQCENLRVEIEGHASAEGDPKKNQLLSEQRAKAVRDWLVNQGVDASKITATVGYGSSKPVAQELKTMTPEELESARRQNRRITIRLVEPCK